MKNEKKEKTEKKEVKKVKVISTKEIDFGDVKIKEINFDDGSTKAELA